MKNLFLLFVSMLFLPKTSLAAGGEPGFIATIPSAITIGTEVILPGSFAIALDSYQKCNATLLKLEAKVGKKISIPRDVVMCKVIAGSARIETTIDVRLAMKLLLSGLERKMNNHWLSIKLRCGSK